VLVGLQPPPNAHADPIPNAATPMTIEDLRMLFPTLMTHLPPHGPEPFSLPEPAEMAP
jgi:hypothetical protein